MLDSLQESGSKQLKALLEYIVVVTYHDSDTTIGGTQVNTDDIPCIATFESSSCHIRGIVEEWFANRFV